jgi:hypothetical protein
MNSTKKAIHFGFLNFGFLSSRIFLMSLITSVAQVAQAEVIGLAQVAPTAETDTEVLRLGGHSSSLLARNSSPLLAQNRSRARPPAARSNRTGERAAPAPRPSPHSAPKAGKQMISSAPYFSSIQRHAVGLILLAPTGLSYKFTLDKDQAFDAALSISDSYTFYAHTTYLRKMPWALDLEVFPVEFYYGAGGRLIDREEKAVDRGEDTLQMSLRAPVGASVNFNSPDIEAFSELALVANITPKTTFDVTLGLGARYRF